jgi:flagellar protein FliT
MSHDLPDPYHAIERTSLQMVQAARRDDWTEVGRLEAASRLQVEQLQAQTTGAPLSPEQKARKRSALLAILRHDAQVRRLADPAQANLELLLNRPAAGGLH